MLNVNMLCVCYYLKAGNALYIDAICSTLCNNNQKTDIINRRIKLCCESNLFIDSDSLLCLCAFVENDGSVDFVLSGDVESKNSPRFVESDEPDTLPKRQFKKAEIADAVMGTEASLSPSDIESFIPKNMKGPQSGFSPPCDESSDQCAEPALAGDEESPEETSSESPQQVPD